jgi:hypothetical protein
MTTQDQTINNIIERLSKLEAVVFSAEMKPSPTPLLKSPSLAEIVRGKKMKNGQEKIASIIGFYEKEMGRLTVSILDIEEGWSKAKFTGRYAPMLLKRSVQDGLINDYGNEKGYVLTQTGESFYQELKNKHGSKYNN